MSQVAIIGLTLTILLAVIFTGFQAYEYVVPHRYQQRKLVQEEQQEQTC